jgi:glutamate synthase domain-containing protein 3
MTRGEVVVLGPTGFNVGAGMTGGVLYVLDEDGKLDGRLNKWYVTAVDLEKRDKGRLKSLIEAHLRYTNSPFAGEIHSDFENRSSSFKKIVPK